MSRASVLGIILGLSAVFCGNLLEGGKFASILQPTAAVTVFGGTFGATLLSFPMRDMRNALVSLRAVFFEKRIKPEQYIEECVRLSRVLRHRGLMAIEPEIPGMHSEFLKRGMRLISDHMNARMLRETMEQEVHTYEIEQKMIVRVFETAGGFAPTIGIIGAVLGLIHVMENLSDPGRLGAGIAVAFVSTIYGVGIANLVLLPIAKKLNNRLYRALQVREMIIEGVAGIQAGTHPHFLEQRLRCFLEKDDRR